MQMNPPSKTRRTNQLKDTMSETHQRKKRNLLLNQELQGKFIFKTFVIFILSALAFTVFLALMTYNTQTIVYEGYQLKLGTTPLILWKQMIYGNWIFIVLGGIVLIGVSILLTHRIAGPLFRFEKCLDSMITGDLTDKLALREKDEGKQLSSKINHFNGILSEKISSMRTASQKIEQEIMVLKKNSTMKASTATSDNGFDEIERLNADLKDILSAFSTLDKKAK